MKKRTRTVRIEVEKTEYQRYKILDESRRKLLIDMRCIRAEQWAPINYGFRSRVRWNSPQHLQGLVDEYFASCHGVIYNSKTGLPFMDKEGNPVIGQIKPYTISGLASFLHVDSHSIRRMQEGVIDSLGYPTDEDYVGLTYSEIIKEARRKIEAYAEERLYDKDGFNGGKFVLDCAFRWNGSKEEEEIKNMKHNRKMSKKQFELKKSVLEGADGEDNEIQITIKRAGEG